jgi:hypothetical protein
MSTSEGYSTLIFFCIFEVLGGAALGAGLRSILRRKPNPLTFFLALWGSGFACVPLFIGAAILYYGDHPTLFYGQLFVFVLAVIVGALMPEDLLQKDSTGHYSNAIVGAVLCLIGIGALAVTWKDGLDFGPIIGVVLAIAGAAILLLAARDALRAI